jgi:hypothetical protein
MSMTDKQVVEGAERMARELLSAFGGHQSGEPSIRKSDHPRAISAWSITERLLETYNGTDLKSAVASVDDEDEAANAEQALKLGPQHLGMLENAKVGACGCGCASTDYRKHLENCGYRLLCEVAEVLAAQQPKEEVAHG